MRVIAVLPTIEAMEGGIQGGGFYPPPLEKS